MLKNKHTNKICLIVIILTIIIAAVFIIAASQGWIDEDTSLGYENKLFDTSTVHSIDILMEDWEGFLATCTDEEYVTCDIVIDGETYSNVAIRAKGNTSLTSVASYGNDRYSFKIEFDHYNSANTYYGLDKLSLNNLISDNTYMKDYLCYQMMAYMGVPSPLTSFVYITVNGEEWGLYLAVEGIKEAFLQRNYGKIMANSISRTAWILVADVVMALSSISTIFSMILPAAAPLRTCQLTLLRVGSKTTAC